MRPERIAALARLFDGQRPRRKKEPLQQSDRPKCLLAEIRGHFGGRTVEEGVHFTPPRFVAMQNI